MKVIKYIYELMKHIKEKDPSIHTLAETILVPFFSAIIGYNISHYLYKRKHFFLARMICEHEKRKTGIEIHPGATIGKNFFIDHGIGTVIGEEAVIGNNVMLYHLVTLGSNGKKNDSKAKRIKNDGKYMNDENKKDVDDEKNILLKKHPTIEDNVIIGAGAKVLGNVVIGKNSKIGAGAVVVHDVRENSTVIGIPAREVKVRYKINELK